MVSSCDNKIEKITKLVFSCSLNYKLRQRDYNLILLLKNFIKNKEIPSLFIGNP
jgi:hypothetical protein